jgi:hypothetical protein
LPAIHGNKWQQFATPGFRGKRSRNCSCHANHIRTGKVKAKENEMGVRTMRPVLALSAAGGVQ